jgi:hypothetical protein
LALRGQGGVNALHPWNPDTALHLAEVGGPDFGDIKVDRQPEIVLPPMVHQIRVRKALRGQLDDAWYVLGAAAAIGSRGVKPSAYVREIVGLRAEQRMGLVLFGHDEVLEEIWPRRLKVAEAIAATGYDFCVAPSYSAYHGRPRTEYLFNIKRSLSFLSLLHHHGVPVIPRVAWLIEHDVFRLAQWVEDNPAVHMVALDLSSSSPTDWRHELRLLALFDRVTERRLSYFIHGPSVVSRCVDLYRTIGRDRVHISNGRALARPAVAGMSFRERLAREQSVIDSAWRALDTSEGATPRGVHLRAR